MSHVSPAEDEAEVWSSLAEVTDPELDESIVELGFVASLDVSDGCVAIGFRLPTYWCSPNFAFMMACDIRDRVSELVWVRNVRVELLDHCTADSINRGIASHRSFEDVFREETTGDLAELRMVFRRKAFMARQERLLKYLLASGLSAPDIVVMTLRDLQSSLAPDGERLRRRYVAIRSELGIVDEAGAPAFLTLEGNLLTSSSFRDYLGTLRKCRLNMEISTHLCRGLLSSRYDLIGGSELEAVPVQSEPAPLIWLKQQGPADDRRRE